MASSEFMNELLQNLVVGDNAVRTAAEHHYEMFKKSDQCTLLPGLLLQAIGEATLAMHLRQLSAVLLRRILVEDCDGIYQKMSSEG